MHTAQLLAAYDHQVRGSFPNRLPATWTATHEGPLTRCHTQHGGFVLADSGLRSWTREEIDALVSRTLDHYGHADFEWKTFSHDNPDVVASLIAHGFVTDEPETLVLGDVAIPTRPERRIGGEPPIAVRVGTLDDLPAVAAMEEAVRRHGWEWFVPELTAHLTADAPTHLVLAEDRATGQVVSAGWLAPPGRGPLSPVSGADPRWRLTGVVASTGPSFARERTRQHAAASNSCRWMPARTAAHPRETRDGARRII